MAITMKNFLASKKSVNPKALRVLYSFLGFAVLAPTLGPAAFITVWVCVFFGYREFMISRTWHEDKLKKLAEGVSRKELKEDYKFIGRYFKYAWLPLFSYCLLIYSLYHLSNNSEIVRDWLWSYFGMNKNFYFYSGYLYETIGRHYAIVMHNNILRAEMLAHIYAVIFNAMVLLPLCFLPSLPAWMRHARAFELRGHGKTFCLFGTVFFVAVILMMLWLYGFIFDAPHMKETRRWSYHVLLNDKFLLNLSIFSTVFTSSINYVVALTIGYFVTFFKGSPEISQSRKND